MKKIDVWVFITDNETNDIDFESYEIPEKDWEYLLRHINDISKNGN